VKRHPALIPLSHDHHHALVQARRLRKAAAASPPEQRRAARAFAEFFAAETTAHFREEEELLFPLVAGSDRQTDDLLAQLLLEHAELRALVLRLGREVESETLDEATMRRLGDLLERHVRSEERELFPLIAQTATESDLAGLQLPQRHESGRGVGELVHPGELAGSNGPLWGAASEDLNATLLGWDEGLGTPRHVNAVRDVLVVVLAGKGTVRIGATEHAVGAGDVVLIAKGTQRQITAGRGGLRYLTTHLRRGGLAIAPGG
jgi:hemerythrin-like domain-containing protein